MPRRFMEPHDRFVFAAIGAWAVFLGVLLLADKGANDEIWLHDLWPTMLVAGGLLTFAFSWRLVSFRLRGWSSALLVVACVGRGVAAVLGLLNSTADTAWRGLAEMAVFTMVGFLLYVTWRARVPSPVNGPPGWRS